MKSNKRTRHSFCLRRRRQGGGTSNKASTSIHVIKCQTDCAMSINLELQLIFLHCTLLLPTPEHLLEELEVSQPFLSCLSGIRLSLL